MKSTVSIKEFQQNLSLVLRAIPARPSHPILSSMLFEADESSQQIKLTGFDLSLAIETKFSAQVEKGGKLAIPAKLLHDIISRIGGSDVILASHDNTVEIESNVGKYSIQSAEVSEYPELPLVKNSNIYKLPSAAIIDGLKLTGFAASNDDTKQVLTGIRLTVLPEEIRFAATDGHRLTESVIPANIECGDGFSVTIPARIFGELERIASGYEMLSFWLDGSQIAVFVDSKCIIGRLLEGEYPRYQSLFVSKIEGSITVDRKLFLESLNRISVLAAERNNLAKCLIKKGSQQLILSTECADVGSGSESIPAQITSSIQSIAFNCKYLSEGLKVMRGSEIRIDLASENAPITISPLGELAMRYLVMPVQLRS